MHVGSIPPPALCYISSLPLICQIFRVSIEAFTKAQKYNFEKKEKKNVLR